MDKVNIELMLDATGTIEYTRVKVLMQLIKDMNSNYRVIETEEVIGTKIGKSASTVSRVIRELIEQNYLVRETDGVYMVSPRLIRIKGVGKTRWKELIKEFQVKLITKG